MMYNLELELRKKGKGADKKLAEKLGITRQAVWDFLKKQTATYTSQEKYTKAFNEAFKTKFTEDYLFTLVEGEIE